MNALFFASLLVVFISNYRRKDGATTRVDNITLLPRLNQH